MKIMSLLKHCSALLLLTFMYFFTVVLAMWSVSIAPATLTVWSWDSVVYNATVSSASWSTTFSWFIDWVPVPWVSTASLDVSWSWYVSLFPSDATADATRIVQVDVTDDALTYSWTAILVVDHMIMIPIPTVPYEIRAWWKNYCGDGVAYPELWEECDDGNGKFGDGCTMNCECEAWYICSVDDLWLTTISDEAALREEDDAWSNWEDDTDNSNGGDSDKSWSKSDSNNQNGQWDDKTPIKNEIKARNSDPLILSDQQAQDTRMPLSAPQVGADYRLLMSLEDDWYMTRDSIVPMQLQTNSISVPLSLPKTGRAERFQPARTTIL